MHPVPVSLLSHGYGEALHFHTDLGFAFLADGLPMGVPGSTESPQLIWVGVGELRDLADVPDHAREVAKFVLEFVRTTWVSVDAAAWAEG